MLKIVLFLSFSLLLIGSGIEAEIWYVYPDGSGDAPTIKAAVDSAVAGDAVLLVAGDFYEDSIIVDGKDILIESAGGKTYINAALPGSGVGFLLRNVTSSMAVNSMIFRGFDTAIEIESSSPGVNYMTFEGCVTGVTVSGASSGPSITLSLFDSCGTAFESTDGAGTAFMRLTIVDCDCGARISGGDADLSRNIFYGCDTGIECTGGSPVLDCNDFFKNVIDYAGCTPGGTDFFDDPIFCLSNPPPIKYFLHETSPCLAEYSPCGVRVGAFPAGCSGEAVEKSSWGVIKRQFR